MNKLYNLFSILLFAFCIAVIPGCGKDDEPVDPNKPGNVDPNSPTSDPIGTVTMRMRNDTETKLGGMYVSSDNNFYCNRGMIASLGSVTGLGNITDIPLTGWSDQVAVLPGTGYMYYDGNQYYRIYTMQWIKEVGSDNILGIEMKYQTPFKGVDEPINLENNTVSFSGDGGEDEIWFTNESIIPFTVSSDQSWCQVRRCTSKDETFLYDGVYIYVSPATNQDESRAKVEIKTLYGKRTILTVVRSGETPHVTFPNGESDYTREDISASGENSTVYIDSNIEAEDITITGNSDWFTAEIVGTSKGENSRRVRHIEGKESPLHVSSRSSMRYSLHYTVSPNYTEKDREAKITISSKKGENAAFMNVSQRAGSLTIDREYSSVEVNASAQDVTLYYITNVYGDYKVTSDKAWCEVSQENINIPPFGGTTTSRSVRLSLSDNTSDKNRDATITIASAEGSLKVQIKIIQLGISTADIPTTLYFDREASYTTVTMPVSNLVVKSSVEWCSVSTNGNKVTVRVDETSEDRKTALTIEGVSLSITVDQSKYKVGDQYEENNISGTVCMMDGEKRLIRSELLGKCEYSIENVLIGTDDVDNGMANMTIVKKLAGWQKFYPAFALCDGLNTNGVSGWYLPARNEVAGVPGWTSTESNESGANYRNSNGKIYNDSKINHHEVYAVHQFVK